MLNNTCTKNSAYINVLLVRGRNQDIDRLILEEIAYERSAALHI